MLLLLISVSTTKAAFMSLIIPGSGDIALGNKNRGVAFVIAEGMIWTGYGIYTVFGRDLRNEYLNFAVLRAGANPNRNDEVYLDALEWYNSNEDYNEYIKELAREIYPDTTDTTILNKRRNYIREHSIGDEYGWNWDSEVDFKKYITLRKKSRHYFGTASTIASLAIVNRLLSFILTSYFNENVSIRLDKNHINFTWRF